MEKRGHKLYEELGELARFVETAMKAISEASPQITSSAAQLPTAASHLADLSKMTEDGTMEVMRLTETLQDNRDRIGKELASVAETMRATDCAKLAERVETLTALIAEDGKHLTGIMTTLAFQDLVAQRVKKLVTILDEVQSKLMHLVVVFGLQQNSQASMDHGLAGQMLKQLEESKTPAMKQQIADDLLAQFGFK